MEHDWRGYWDCIYPSLVYVSLKEFGVVGLDMYTVGLPGLGLAGSRDLGFGFPRNGGIPRPHQVTWSQPINMHPVRNKGRAEKPKNA